jgi:chitinase
MNPIPLSFWQRSKFQAVNSALAARPPVGGPNGVQPETPNDRIMEAFGSFDYPYPFLPTDASINGAKGKFMQRHVPTALTVITDLANEAVRDDTQADADALLSSIRIVSYYHTYATLI